MVGCYGVAASGDGSMKRTNHYERWTQDEIDLIMTSPSAAITTAVMLGLYTGQRLSDVVKMRWSDCPPGAARGIIMRQKKTGTVLFIPMHPKLFTMLEGLSLASSTSPYIVRQDRSGMHYTTQVFRVKFGQELKRLGITKKFHGLRVTMACRLAEAGATTQEIMAIGGWKTSRQVDLYCGHVDQVRLAENAMRRL